MEKIKRIEILDAMRGFALVAMVLYHSAYDIWAFKFFKGGKTVSSVTDFVLSGNLWIVALFFQCIFIFVAGISCNFSRNNLKRGFRILAFAYIITITTSLINNGIWFGILHFLGFSILIYLLLKKIKLRIEAVPAAVWLLLFVLAYSIPNILLCVKNIAITPIEPVYIGIFGFKTELPLYILGLYSFEFNTVDYFPVIPNIFIFFTGVSFGRLIKENRMHGWFYYAKVPFLPLLGRHSLLIYVLHQPLILGLLWGLDWMMNK